jgi:hypothetical protein
MENGLSKDMKHGDTTRKWDRSRKNVQGQHENREVMMNTVWGGWADGTCLKADHEKAGASGTTPDVAETKQHVDAPSRSK